MSKLDKVQKSIDKHKEDALIKLSQDKDMEVKLAAIAGMGQIGSDDSFNSLIVLLSDADLQIRIAAIKALAAMKNTHANAHLTHRLAVEKDESAIAAIKAAIGELHKVGME